MILLMLAACALSEHRHFSKLKMFMASIRLTADVLTLTPGKEH